MLLTSLIAAALFAFPGNLEGRVFKPRTSVYQPTAKTVDTGVIILQGASIAPSRYAGLANAIQKEFPKPVWVVVPETVFETPLSFLGAGKAIERAKRGLLDHGMAEDGAIFLAGHSLGGIAAQEYVHEHPEFAQGLILMGSALLRKFNVSDPLALPVISINGELDCQVYCCLVALLSKCF